MHHLHNYALLSFDITCFGLCSFMSNLQCMDDLEDQFQGVGKVCLIFLQRSSQFQLRLWMTFGWQEEIWDQGQGLLIVDLGMWSIILYYLCSFMSNLQWMIWRIRFKGLPDFLAKVQLIVSSYDSSYALMHLSPSIVIHEWHSMRECVQRYQRFQRGTLHVMLGHWSHSSTGSAQDMWQKFCETVCQLLKWGQLNGTCWSSRVTMHFKHEVHGACLSTWGQVHGDLSGWFWSIEWQGNSAY